jgi:hypothetical protein
MSSGQPVEMSRATKRQTKTQAVPLLQEKNQAGSGKMPSVAGPRTEQNNGRNILTGPGIPGGGGNRTGRNLGQKMETSRCPKNSRMGRSRMETSNRARLVLRPQPRNCRGDFEAKITKSNYRF